MADKNGIKVTFIRRPKKKVIKLPKPDNIKTFHV